MYDLEEWIEQIRKDARGHYELRVEFSLNSGEIVFCLDGSDGEFITCISSGSNIMVAMKSIEELIAD